MGKLEELKRLTFCLGFVSFALWGYISYSLFDLGSPAKHTLSRFPASLSAASQNEATLSRSIQKIKLSCPELKTGSHFEVSANLIQMELHECRDQNPIELINLTNGYQATLFTATDGALSDLISLKNGANEIQVRLEKNPAPFSLKVNVRL